MGEREKPVNAGKPWTEEDMFFVGSFAPTWRKAKVDTSKSEQAKKILKVRRELGIAIGR